VRDVRCEGALGLGLRAAAMSACSFQKPQAIAFDAYFKQHRMIIPDMSKQGCKVFIGGLVRSGLFGIVAMPGRKYASSCPFRAVPGAEIASEAIFRPSCHTIVACELLTPARSCPCC
jgi:hypothetical protein